MSFSNKRIFSAIGILIIAILAMSLFIKILPVLLVAGVTIWGVFKITKWFENKSSGKMQNNKKDKIAEEFSSTDEEFAYDKDNVVDVDYTEIRR